MARRPDEGIEGGTERRPTSLLGSPGGSQGTPSSGGQPSSGNRPPAPPASKPDDKADVVANLLKQVSEKTDEIGRLCVEVTTLRQDLVEAGRKLSEARAEVQELEARRAALAKSSSEVQTELAKARAAQAMSNDERDRALADAKSAQQFRGDAIKYAAEVGDLRVTVEKLRKEFATANEQVSKANEAVQAEATKAAAAIAKAKNDVEEATKAAAAIAKAEAQELESRISGLETDIRAVEAQRDDAWQKLCDAYAAGFGRNTELEAEVEKLRKELAEANEQVSKANAALTQAKKAAEKFEANKWFAAGAGNGAVRQSTTTQMAVVPADKPSRIKRFFSSVGRVFKRGQTVKDEEEV